MSNRANQIILLTLSVLILSMLTTAGAKTIYVNDVGPADFDTIQAGIDAADDGDTVLVAPGEYVITEPITFRGKAITVRSEAGPEVTTIRLSESISNLNRASVVIFENGETETTLLEGFTISGGKGYWWEYPEVPGAFYQVGGGIFCTDSSPTITGCIVSDNHTILRNKGQDIGGGVFLANSSAVVNHCRIHNNSTAFWAGGMAITNGSPTVTDCIISHNTTNHQDSQSGGLNIFGSSCKPVLLRCTISANSARHAAGGIQVSSGSQPTFIDCLISDNQSGAIGGILSSYSSVTILKNCIITRNSAERSNGGLGCGHNAEAILTNCTITGNAAGSDSGGVLSYDNSVITVRNCIIFGNTAPIGPEIGFGIIYRASMNISYSNIGGGLSSAYINQGCTLNWGQGNIDADPLFAYVANGDYHLKSQAGRWDPNSGSWVKDDVTSPCIDAGDPDSDGSGETWPHGERINMGAYGGTREASMSTRPEAMSLPRVAFIYRSDTEAAESFQSLLTSYGCPTTLIGLDDVATEALDSYDLIVVASDSGYSSTWRDAQSVAPIDRSGKPILGLGEGGYDFFGQLELSIGRPNGAHGDGGSIYAVDPNHVLFGTPYPINIPEDGVMPLYTATGHVIIYLWPEVPETVTVLAGLAGNPSYYPLALEHDRYVFWGFTESPQKMTEVGKILFINVVIWTANAGWETEI